MKRVMVFGTFDILHPGHIEFLRQAKRYGDFLIVSIAREKYVKKIKGRKPWHSERDRKRLLESIKFVDKVILGSKSDYLGHIINQKPDVIVLGYDQRAFTNKLEQKLAKRGLRVRIVRAKTYKSRVYQSRNYLRLSHSFFSHRNKQDENFGYSSKTQRAGEKARIPHGQY